MVVGPLRVRHPNLFRTVHNRPPTVVQPCIMVDWNQMNGVHGAHNVLQYTIMAKIIFLLGFGMVLSGCSIHTNYHHTFLDHLAPSHTIKDNRIYPY